MKKVRLCLMMACCATLLLTSCSNMLDSLEKAAETKESTKNEKSEKADSTESTVEPETTQPLPQEPITPQPQIPEENQEPEEQQPEQQEQQPQEQQPEQQQSQEQQPEQQPQEQTKEISYTVEHYQQNINDDEYTKVAADTQTLTGKTGEQTKATAKTYTGFTAKAFEQKTLADGEASIIKIYYDRNIITYTFNANGGKWTGDKSELSYEGKYGSDFDAAPDDPDKLSPFFDPEKSDANNDYKLTGWDKEIPRTFGTANITFTAQWEIEKTLCKIEHFKQNLNDNGYTKVTADTQEIKLPPMYCDADVPYDYIKTYEDFEFVSAQLNAEHNIEYYYDRKTITSSTLTFISGGDVTVELSGNSFHATPSVAGTYTYEWYLNNVKQSSETDACSIDVQNLAEGFYTLVVKATSSTGIVYVSQYSLPVYGQAQ